MVHVLPLSLLLFNGCGSSSKSFYVRFEDMGPTPLSTWMPSHFAAFQDEVYFINAEGLQVLGEDTPRLDGALQVAATADFVVVTVDAGVARSSDGRTFETVSDESFTALTSVDGAIVAGRISGPGTAAIFRSEDWGATWTDLGEFTLDSPVEQDSEDVQLSPAVDGLVWAQLAGDADFGPNWAYQGKTLEIRGEALTSLDDVHDAPSFPAGTTVDGDVVVDVHTGSVDTEQRRSTDVLPIALIPSYRPGMDFSDAQLISYAMPGMSDTTPVPAVIGLDGQGRLLTNLDGRLARSETALSQDNDQRDQVLAGPGCAKRETFEGAKTSERPEVTVENQTDGPVTAWSIDGEYRWHRIADVQPGSLDSLSDFSLLEGSFFMVLYENGDCAYGHFLKEGIGSLEVLVE